MPNLNYVLLAVNEPLKSAPLYEAILGVPPVERAETFVLFVQPSGLKVGLWAARDMKPEPRAAGGSELSFALPDRASVEAVCASWKALGLQMVQAPTDMDFGFTCVFADLDGHRLRPFARSANPK